MYIWVNIYVYIDVCNVRFYVTSGNLSASHLKFFYIFTVTVATSTGTKWHYTTCVTHYVDINGYSNRSKHNRRMKKRGKANMIFNAGSHCFTAKSLRAFNRIRHTSHQHPFVFVQYEHLWSFTYLINSF